MISEWNDKILAVTNDQFEERALEVFRYQFENNQLYREYVLALGKSKTSVSELKQIPFLPIRFFKSHDVFTGDFTPEIIFESSGTTETINSRHLVKDVGWYKSVYSKIFQQFYGKPEDWCIIGLLPSYLERNNSSLVYMVNGLIKQSGHPESGFYLNEFSELLNVLRNNEKANQQTLLIGVSFALLDFAEFVHDRNKSDLFQKVIFMETGGMKGRRKEMVRKELHETLRKGLGVEAIHSEYGMTELMSQAYAKEDGIFETPPWLRILVRDETDPLSITDYKESGNNRGAINIIDLANLHSCSFLATDDAGRLLPEGRFEVLGRIDGSDIRGCNLLVF